MQQGISGELAVQEWLTSSAKEKEDEDFCGRCHGSQKRLLISIPSAGLLKSWAAQRSDTQIASCAGLCHIAVIAWGGGMRGRICFWKCYCIWCSSILPLTSDLAGSACPLPAPGWNNTALAPTSANIPEVIKHNLHSKEQHTIPSDLEARKTQVDEKMPLLAVVTSENQSLLWFPACSAAAGSKG